MTYGQVKDRVLQLLNQYSVAGEQVSLAYNNQEDYVLRIPALVNDAMMEIATTSRKIPAALTLSTEDEDSYEEVGNQLRFSMPADFYQFRLGDTMQLTEEGYYLHTNLFDVEGERYLLIPKQELSDGQTYTLRYYRYPKLLADKPKDTDELDNVAETHFAIPFYAAAHLVIHDDPFLYSAFYNKYEDKLAKMSPGVTMEVHPIGESDAWAFGCGIYTV